ncbi:hypothetical protein ACIQCF_33420 [Streptomyces sp. NPDC088353]|uniref:hypothetical protein n=1 Tax=Streptomyces sp. NPDC088353 TaxID=3365855 RepID=UPI003829FAFF
MTRSWTATETTFPSPCASSYVLLSDGVLARTERDYKRMCAYAGMARHSGRIPWDAIRDDTQIAVEAPPSFAGPAARVLTDKRG